MILMLQNIFLDRFKPIFFKEQIDIVNISFPIYEEIINNKNSLLDILSENKKKEKIHNLRITKPYLMKIIYYENNRFIEYFILFDNYQESLENYYNDNPNNYSSYDKFIENNTCLNVNNIKKSIYLNELNLKQQIISIKYKYEYIKGTNGKKQLIPIETLIPNKLKVNTIITMMDNYYSYNIIENIDYYLKYKCKKKKNKYEKILYYVFKTYKKDNYLNLLSHDLKRHICKYL